MRKGLITLLVFAVTLTLSFGFLADSADAKRGGGFKSNKQSFTQQKTDTKQSDKASATQSSTKNTSSSAQTPKQGGLFGNSGGFLKGMAIGGLAGMLFGSMIGNMGGFGEIFGFMINLLAIFAIVMVIRALWTYVRNSKKPANNGPNYNRYYDYDHNEQDRENKR